MERVKEIAKVTLKGSIVNLLLVCVKVAAGVAGHSAAMVSDAVHSLSDLLTDFVVLAFVRVSGRPKDASHDYGHGKFETMASLLIGIFLAAAAIGIVVSGAVKLSSWLQGEDIPAPGRMALWAALLSIAAKELLFRYTDAKGRKLDSPALRANAWHHRSDALSSIGAAIGIGGALLLGDRWTVLDPVASILVTLFIVRVAWKLLKECFGDLLEASLPEEVEKEILDVISSFPDVSDPHNLRTRRIGSRYAIEFHIRMDGDIPLVKAHSRAHDIEKLLKEKFGDNTHIVVHVEPVKSIPKD